MRLGVGHWLQCSLVDHKAESGAVVGGIFDIRAASQAR